MRLIALLCLSFFTQMGYAQQLEFDFGHPNDILKNVTWDSPNVEVSYDVPESITKMWDERDFGAEIADGYYGYGPTAQYVIYNDKKEVIGYMMAQTLEYSEDPEYHIAYTVCDANGVTVVELEYVVYMKSEIDVIPVQLQPKPEDAY